MKNGPSRANVRARASQRAAYSQTRARDDEEFFAASVTLESAHFLETRGPSLGFAPSLLPLPSLLPPEITSLNDIALPSFFLSFRARPKATMT